MALEGSGVMVMLSLSLHTLNERRGITPGSPPHRVRQAVFHRANSMLYRPGDRTGTLYDIAFGTVRTYHMMSDGRRQISGFYFAGDVFGLEPQPRHRLFAETVEECAIRPFDQRTEVAGAEALYALAQADLGRLGDHLMLLGHANALARISRFMLDLDSRQGRDGLVTLGMPRADIADFLGLTIETVSRVFTRLSEMRLIARDTARSIELLDRDGLAALCD
ncbi:helix-turn-helix domain-containing protein [Pararhizobium haloflavum]|uniref:helix-turn-helix domain-containing protein n=1 Tax=Pararhizobium haloflavum TaxID=2037914 RepID=UPI000C19F876|nr:helix-turn-helix domain-containing protein [Pararhizobium haloflavum]